MQHLFLWFMISVMTVLVMTEPSYAQFPESLEAQQEFIRKQNEAARKLKEQAKDKRGKRPDEVKDEATDPRPTRSPQSAKNPRPKNNPVSAKTPRSTIEPKVTRIKKEESVAAAVCDIKVPRDCSEALSAANRSCSDQANSCKEIVSSIEDQSCVFIRCDVTRAECMTGALDKYIGCMDAGLKKASADQ